MFRSRHATTPGNQGRYEGFDVLDQTGTWDAVTAGVVLRRLAPQPDVAFFGPAEYAAADALFDALLDQREEPKVPVAALVDERLAKNETDGWRYEDMPEDGEAFRRTLAALDGDARVAFGQPFAACGWDQRCALIQDVQDATGGDGTGRWHGLPAKHVWSLWTRYACAAFYSHPWAWNEIGFGGPAYPRGYKNPGVGAREPWERPERDPIDPVSWAQRAEQARNQSARAVRRGSGGSGGSSGPAGPAAGGPAAGGQS